LAEAFEGAMHARDAGHDSGAGAVSPELVQVEVEVETPTACALAAVAKWRCGDSLSPDEGGR
jgi:hypothetical protein